MHCFGYPQQLRSLLKVGHRLFRPLNVGQIERFPAHTNAATATTRSWSDLEIQRCFILAVLLVGFVSRDGLGFATKVNCSLQPTVVCVYLEGLSGPASSPAHTTGCVPRTRFQHCTVTQINTMNITGKLIKYLVEVRQSDKYLFKS